MTQAEQGVEIHLRQSDVGVGGVSLLRLWLQLGQVGFQERGALATGGASQRVAPHIPSPPERLAGAQAGEAGRCGRRLTRK